MSTQIYLYGIGRNLEETKSLVNVLRDASNNSCEFYYFLLKTPKIDNPRSKEKGEIDYSNLNTLDIEVYEVLLNKVERDKLFSRVKEFRDCHEDGYKSYGNLLNQLSILKEIKNHIKNQKGKSSKNFLLIRDDIKFSKFSKNFLLSLYLNRIVNEGEFLVSSYSWHGGLNDKFFISRKKTCIKVLNRIMNIEECLNIYQHLNAEELLAYTVSKNRLRIKPIFLRVGRCRINNEIIWDNWYPSISRISDILKVCKFYFKG